MALPLRRLRDRIRRASFGRKEAIRAIGERLPLLSPEQDEAILRDAGFADVTLFYAGFTFRGWVGYKADARQSGDAG